MRKRLLSLILILILLLTVLAGCAGNSEPSAAGDTGQTVSQVDTGGETELPKTTETGSETTATEEITSTETTGPETEESKPSEETAKPETMPTDPSVSTTPKEDTTTPPTQTENTETTEPPTQATEEPEESKITETTETPPLAQADSNEVAALVAEYINQYRSSSATVLPGLTKVATYRANELVTNFAHTDGISACNALQYGEYVDMTLYGMPESSNYYQGYNREAIAKGNWTGTADEIAQRIASGFKASAKHWAYVGSSEYGYMAVGVVYDPSNSTWFCCICMSSKDYGG